MKIGALVAGIILLIIAIIGFTSSANTVSQGQTLPGQFGQWINPQAAQQYQQANYSEYGFGGLGAIGLGLLVFGSVTTTKTASKKSESVWKCDYCNFESTNRNEVVEHEQKYEHKKSKPKRNEESTEESDNIRYIGILKERLAKGEISKKDYDDLKKEFDSKS